MCYKSKLSWTFVIMLEVLGGMLNLIFYKCSSNLQLDLQTKNQEARRIIMTIITTYIY